MTWRHVVVALMSVSVFAASQAQQVHKQPQVKGAASQRMASVQTQELPVVTWKKTGNSLYYFSNDKKTWQDAEDFCVAHEAHLASIHNSQENEFVKKNINSETYWIGGKAQENGVFTWVDSTKMKFTSWFVETKRHSFSTFRCVSTHRKGKILLNNFQVDTLGTKWFIAKCNQEQRFVCKKSVQLGASHVKDLPTQRKASVKMPQIQRTEAMVWNKHGSSLYFFSKNKKTWKSAEEFCVAHGSHLTSIHNARENDFLNKNCGSCWIGGESKQKDVVFTWVDSSKMSYTNWFNGSPWKLGETNNCIGISGGKWLPTNCFSEAGFACKKTAQAQSSYKMIITPN
ncbi:hypothetical protein L596_022726 [Steinernema carpocapsae]|uniref:C-type lectin domain-containing protein n=1 Tax=Steinernema carpocapsae TaxID=34508 RepID=A0A4U5MMK9_STECR|nr:hypothetical protein L596_022726 [Steinernema carpocapsae]